MYNNRGELVVPLTAAADVTTTANIPDNKMYVPLTSSSSSSSSVFSLPSLCYMTADPQDMMTRNCTSITKVLKIDLVCPIKRYEKIPRRGLSLYAFMNRYWSKPSTIRGEYPSNL